MLTILFAAQAQDRHCPVAGKRWRRWFPTAGSSKNMRVHPQMIPQHMTCHPFAHSFAKTRIDHPAKRHGDRGIANDGFHPGSEAKDRLQPGKAREISQVAVGGVDDIVHLFRRSLGHHAEIREACSGNGTVKRSFVFPPTVRASRR